MCQEHSAVTPMRLKPATPESQVKHSFTEPLRSWMCLQCVGLLLLVLGTVRKMIGPGHGNIITNIAIVEERGRIKKLLFYILKRI